MSEIETFLASTALFANLSGLELTAVSAFLERRLLKKGAIVFREGQRGEELFIVLTGRIGSCVKQADGTQRKIYEFVPGRFFGEMAIIESEPRSATCWAEEDSQLLALEGLDFYRLIFLHPIIGLKILTNIGTVMCSWLDESSRFLGDLVRWGETARRRSVEDGLTGLFNRRFLEESLESRFTALAAGGRPVSLIMMDLDRFRDINAAFGAEGGDQTIRAVGDAIRGVLRDGDVAARLSGDEFAVLLPDTNCAEALKVSERLRAAVEAVSLPFPSLSGGRPRVVKPAASLGTASAPIHAGSPKELIDVADRALARAKQEGRNRVVCAI